MLIAKKLLSWLLSSGSAKIGAGVASGGGALALICYMVMDINTKIDTHHDMMILMAITKIDSCDNLSSQEKQAKKDMIELLDKKEKKPWIKSK